MAKRIGPALQPSDALDIHHVLHFPNALHDALELVEILHLDHEVVDALAVVCHGDLGLRDIAVSRGDGRGDLGQQPGPVPPDVDGDLDRALGRLLAVPLDGQQALLVEHILDHGHAVTGVHRQPPPPRDETHDAVARYRRAALAEAHEDIVHAADADGALTLPG